MKSNKLILEKIKQHYIGQEVRFIKEITGCTNINLIFEIDGKQYFCRVVNQSKIPLHHNELRCLKYLIHNDFKHCPQIIIEKKDFYLLEFLDGYLLKDDVSLIPNSQTIISTMRELHAIKPYQSTQEAFSELKETLFKEMKLQPAIIEKLTIKFKDFEINILQNNKNIKETICHADLHSGNIIFSNQQQCKFIDFEYAVCFYNYYDITCFFAEFCGIECDLTQYPDDAQKEILLKQYFGQSYVFNDLEKNTIKFFEILTFGAWSFWGNKMNFKEYSIQRLNKFSTLIE